MTHEPPRSPGRSVRSPVHQERSLSAVEHSTATSHARTGASAASGPPSDHRAVRPEAQDRASAPGQQQGRAPHPFLARLRTALRHALPHGVDLSERAWRTRHRAILTFLGALTLAVVVWALVVDRSGHNVAEAAVMALVAVGTALVPSHHRRLAASAASVAMLLATAVLVHLSGGLIEMHFLFFVIVAAVALYQQWAAFLSAVGFVVLHHGVVGTLFPESTYNHPDAIAHPWLWAAVHGGFVALASIVGLAAWRLEELVRDELVAATAELRLSEALQRSLLTEPDVPPHLEVAVRYRPAAAHVQVGGDWYDAFAVPSGAFTVVIGDATGHDREAAAVMAQIRNLLRGVSMTLRQSPAAVLSRVDEALAALAVDAMASALVGQVEGGRTPDDPTTLRWSSAGHHPPLFLLPDGGARLLEAPADLLLGVDPRSTRHDHEVDLPCGAFVVLYTDGLVERRGQGTEPGVTELLDRVRGRHGLSAEALCDLVLDNADPRHDDDVAVLALRARCGADAARHEEHGSGPVAG